MRSESGRDPEPSTASQATAGDRRSTTVLPLFETYVFEFSGDLYGQQIEIDLVGWIRGEEKFGSTEALVARMKIDEAEARQLLARP